MALAASRLEVHTAIITQLRTLFAADVDGETTRPIYARDRRAPQNTEGQIIERFNDEDGVLNFIMVRYIGLQREVYGVQPETVSKNYVFEIEVRRAKNERDPEDDAIASETLFNAELDLLETLFENTNLGLDAGVTTAGFVVLQPIPRDGEAFYSKLTHVARGALVVNVAAC